MSDGVVCDGSMRVVDEQNVAGRVAEKTDEQGGFNFTQSPSTPSSPDANTRAQSPHKS